MNKVIIDLHIDCDPMRRFQELLGKDVFKILGQPYRKPDYCLFGDWVWNNIETDEEIQKKIGDFLKKAYNNNMCRYCQWAKDEE